MITWLWCLLAARLSGRPNDTIKVKIEENVREDDVFVIQTSAPPVNHHFVELLLLIDALKYASSRRITAVLPYYPYVRSDKKDEPRISISARLVADLLQAAGADRILTITLHSPQIVAFSRIPVDQLWATSLLCNFMRMKDLSNAVVVSPDVGSADEASAYARRLGLPMAIMDKRRHADDEKAEIKNMIGEVEGRDALLFDDEVLTGGSMMESIQVLKERGVRRILAGCTHGVFFRASLREDRCLLGGSVRHHEYHFLAHGQAEAQNRRVERRPLVGGCDQSHSPRGISEPLD